jgi:serine protease
LQVIPNDPLYSSSTGNADGQWWLFPYSATQGVRLTGVPDLPSAWATTTGTPVVVAVLDTGITAHPELVGRVLPGYDFVSEVEFSNDGDGRDADAADPGDWVSQQDLQDPLYQGSGCIEEPSSWHGTVIAGQVAALTNNAQGIAAVNWNGRILPVRVAGKCGATVADIVAGMRWAAGIPVPGVPANPHPARIVNISFGGSAACDQAYQSAIDELLAHGVIVVAAAGNESGTPTRPASCERTIGVAALNRDGFKASYSNFGPALDIATVGGDAADPNDPLSDSGLLTINNDGTTMPGVPDYAYVTGTSFAAPIVAGVAALMWSVNPSLSAQQLIDGLKSSARAHVLASPSLGACSPSNPTFCECSTTTCGAGILDAPGALRYAQQTAGGGGGDDGGGGVLGLGWLAGLVLAVALLAGERLGAGRRA